MLRTWFFASIAVAIGLTGFSFVRSTPAPLQPGAPPAKLAEPALPLSHVVLFSSGVGYFQREGEIDGDARVDLQFPAADINDLIKSLVLEDTGGGKVAAVSYDSQDPIHRTLRSFALDVTLNPSLGELLNQARGERVEVTMGTTAGQPATFSGTIVGMESQRQPHGKDQTVDADMLNLLSPEGLRSLTLAQVQRVRFLNPALDADLKRALEAIAGARNHEKKSVSLSFRGVGKRTARVGYVVESPVWKSSYRLVLDGNAKGQLQGWAVVENTSDDDWNSVRMSLVSGRPISYQMDLYPSLYVPRPTVELERYASLRPPNYGGAMVVPQGGIAGGNNQSNMGFAGGQFGIGGGAVGGGGGNNQTSLGIQGGMAFNRYQLGGQLGFGGGNAYPVADLVAPNANARRLSFEELQKRKGAFNTINVQVDESRSDDEIRGIKNVIDPSASVASVATAADIGDVCHFTIDDRVTLPRQKSTMLPIVKQTVDAQKLSIFNESVHAKYPLLGIRLKNGAKQPLMQGPITVYDAGAYAGDSRVPDLQPNEERLLSYAIDLGTEVKVDYRHEPQGLHAIKLVKGVLHTTHRFRDTRSYLIKNRSNQERTVLIEHGVRETWRLIEPEKPAERSRDVYRFVVTVPAGKLQRLDVVEEQRGPTQVGLSQADDAMLRVLLNHAVPSPKLKESLEKAIMLKDRWTDLRRELADMQNQLRAITEDQSRMRANFEKMPATSAAYKRYLEKFDVQETEIEKLQAAIQAKQSAETAARKEYEDFIAGLNVDA